MSSASSRDYRSLYRRLGYQFRDPQLLDLAFTHRSAGALNYERLEFLGDSILNFVVGEALFLAQPKATEGELSRLRASLVKGVTLTEIATEMELGQYLKLGSGELKSGGHRRASILADAVESIIGAIYLDAGFATCRDCIRDWFGERLKHLPSAESLKDPKTRLQEWLQSRSLALPEYQIIATRGAEHEREFHVACHIPQMPATKQPTHQAADQTPDQPGCFEGLASSRRKAEQAAARKALDTLLAAN